MNNNRMVATALLVGLLICDAKTYSEPSHEWVTDAVVANNVEFFIFFSEAVQENVSYHIYLPDEYHNSPSKRFPVLFWLHGSGGGLPGISILSSFFDNAIVGGRIPPMLVVFPNGLPHGMWCDSKDGSTPIESMMMNDLIPHIDQTYRTIGSAEGRIIEGFSMGGYGAGRIGFKFPETFAAFSMLGSGPLQLDFLDPTVGLVPIWKRIQIFETVYGGDWDYFEAQSPWRLAEQFAESEQPTILIRQIIGQLDGTLIPNQEFHEHITALQIDHDYQEIPSVGHQTMALLNALGPANWTFYNTALSRMTISCVDVDLQPDGHIGISDLAIMVEDWLEEGVDLRGDINRNGVVNIDDLYIFSLFWLCDCQDCS